MGDPDDLRVPADKDRSGIVRGDSFTFDFAGESISAHHGETIAGALLAAGHRELRRTRNDDTPRGLFCAIGTCFDCLVCVDGGRPTRACITSAAPKMSVEPSHGR